MVFAAGVQQGALHHDKGETELGCNDTQVKVNGKHHVTLVMCVVYSVPSGLLTSSLKALRSFLHSAQNSTMACALWTKSSSSVRDRPAVLL